MDPEKIAIAVKRQLQLDLTGIEGRDPNAAHDLRRHRPHFRDEPVAQLFGLVEHMRRARLVIDDLRFIAEHGRLGQNFDIGH